MYAGSLPSRLLLNHHLEFVMSEDSTVQLATLGSGCFWCSQAVFARLRGVNSVRCGYAGGGTDHPTYEQVCSGTTGHAEVVQITFDPDTISFDDLLQVFFQTHDPTTRNRQGNDVGTQYRSVIFYHDQPQRELARRTMNELDSTDAFPGPIVTQLVPSEPFFEAEPYHQAYFEAHPDQAYCAAVIGPKLDKFRKRFADMLAQFKAPGWSVP